jgi:hypothetical protein
VTLPASGAISLTQVMDELRVTTPGRAYPIALGDNDVRALAGVPSGPISLSNLYGKSSYIPMTITKVDGELSAMANGTQYLGHAYPSVSASNGSGGYTYAWSIVSASDTDFTLASAAASTVDVRHTITKFGYSGACVLQCSVTDNTGHVVVVGGINATFDVYSNA